MKLTVKDPICYLRVKNLWKDVTLLVFGVYKDGPNDKLERLNSYTHTDFPLENGTPRAVKLEKIPTVPPQSPTSFKYKSLRFSIDAWPNDVGNVEFELIPNQSVVTNTDTDNVKFTLSRQLGDTSRIHHDENLVAI